MFDTLRQIVAPTSCPSCGSELEQVNAQLFCRSLDCPAQNTKKLQAFCTKMKIKGFGEATLAKLDLLDLNELYYLSTDDCISKGFSEKMATKLVDQVQSKLQQGFPFSDFVAACSIPLIGSSVAAKLQVVAEDLLDVTKTTTLPAGVGEKATHNLTNWLQNELPLYLDTWCTHIVASKKSSTKPMGVVCITGKLNDFTSREKAKQYLEDNGFIVKSSVTKDVQYLICEDGTRGSSYNKAIQNNIKITTIKQLLEEF